MIPSHRFHSALILAPFGPGPFLAAQRKKPFEANLKLSQKPLFSPSSINIAILKPVANKGPHTAMLRFCSLAFLCLSILPAVAPAQNAAPVAASLMKQAETAYQAKRYGESESLFSRALPLVQDDDRAGVEYSLACAQALAGDRASAFESLDHAVDDGYIARKEIDANKNLELLHTDPRWKALLDRMTILADRQDALWGDAAFATPGATNIADADKIAGLAELWAQARFGFANFWHVPQLNWDKTYRDFIPKVLASRSTEDYYRVLESFYALLEDGHTGVYPPDEIERKVNWLPLRTRLVDGQLVVIGSRDPAANLQGLHAGDEVLTINSEPAIGWAEHNVAPFVSASTIQDRNSRIYDYKLFLATIGTTFTLGTRTPSGKQATHVFEVTKSTSQHVPLFDLRFLPGNIAYVALNGFYDDTAAKEWDKHWPEISKADSLILDLRENGGGSSSVGDHIMATIIDKTAPGELSRSTRWIATYRAWGKTETPLRFPVDTVEPDPARHFSGPAVLLTSPRTYSAGEDMVVVFIQAHRGRTIGEPTGGSTGQPLMFKLPGGGFARVCTKHDSFADGREFVGVGIQPDIPVHLTRADIIAGRDSVLEAAIHALQPNP
jgi:carboxyl-terminal processing protease